MIARKVRRSPDEIVDDFKLAQRLRSTWTLSGGSVSKQVKIWGEGGPMKKSSWIVFGLSMAICFLIVLSYGFKKTQKINHKVTEIHAASETAIKSYLKSSAIPPVTYPSSPLFYDLNECILVCFVLVEDSGGKCKMEFKILLHQDKKVWKADIIKVKRINKRDRQTK
jgi:hypothetical protein